MTDVFRTEYRKLTTEEQSSVTAIKEQARVLYDEIDNAPRGGGESMRYAALARTALEESVLWAVKSITG